MATYELDLLRRWPLARHLNGQPLQFMFADRCGAALLGAAQSAPDQRSYLPTGAARRCVDFAGGAARPWLARRGATLIRAC